MPCTLEHRMNHVLRSKNLNLVPILQAILQYQSVVKAAEELNLTQSTVSGALARLREVYNDPILIRVGRSSELSPFALKLKPKVDFACDNLADIFRKEEFDPKTVEHHFWIAAPDYLTFLISRDLVGQLNAEAPNIKVHFVNVPLDLTAQLTDMSIDLAVCADFNIWQGVRKETLFQDKTIIAVAEGHSLLDQENVYINDLLKYPSVFYDPSFSPRASKLYAPPNTDIPLMEWNPRMQISSAQIVDQLFVAAETDAVVRVPLSMFNYMKKRLQLRSISVEGEDSSYPTNLFWSEEQDQSEGGKWLRSKVKEVLENCQYIER